MVKLLHTADWHFRPMQYSRSYRGADFTNSAREVIKKAIELGVDAILNSGDVLNSTRPTPSVIEDLKEIHEMLLDAGLAMYLISGNHDRTDPHWSRVLASNRNKGTGIILVDNTSFEVKGVKVNALAFMGNSEFLEREAEMPKADILMWHGALQGFIPGFPDENAVPMESLPTKKYQLILLGDLHVHHHEFIGTGKTKTRVAYPGSTEMCNKSEDPDKVVDVYTQTEDGWEVETHAIPTRKAFFYTIRSPQDLAQVMQELEASKEEHPLIFISHAQDINDVYARICTVVDPTKCVLRVSKEKTGKDKPILEQFVDDKKQPQDFLHMFMAKDTWIYNLGLQMLQEDTDASVALDLAVEAQLLEESL